MNLTSSISTVLKKAFAPKAHFMSLLNRARISSPSNKFFKRNQGFTKNNLEEIITRVLKRPYGLPSNIPPIFVTDVQKGQVIDLRDMFGCCASKSPFADYNELANGLEVPENSQEANYIYKKVFQGRGDHIARHGENASVVQQAWDDNKWFVNEGGSHRSAALWRYHLQNNIARLIKCDVEHISVNPAFTKFSSNNDMWIFSVEDLDSFLEVFELTHPSRDTKRNFSDINIKVLDSSSGHCSLVIPKTSECLKDISSLMKESNALNLSHWVLKPQQYSFTKDCYLVHK